MTLDRRDFVRLLGAGAGAVATGACATTSRTAPTGRGERPAEAAAAPSLPVGRADVVVIGAGAFGAWSALHLQRMGVRVLLVDKYGPGNSRATSGGETRGVRSSYGDRPHGELWARWASEAIRRWRAWDERWSKRLLPRLFFPTADLIFREEWEPFLERTKANWDATGVAYEILEPEEVAYRYPVIDLQGIGAVLHEPGAGVVRARRAIESVARVFEREGGEIRVAEAVPGRSSGGRLADLRLTPDTPNPRVSAAAYVFACGPWLPKLFPELLGTRIRIPRGYVYYFGTPPGDPRFTFPHLPSYNFPGVTGWPALGPDHRGFRVRTGGAPAADPDTTQRTIPPAEHGRPRAFLAERFPLLRAAPILETRACHYELSVTRNFIIDRHPEWQNVWIAGGGSAEAFKFGPVTGEYVARRVLDRDREPELAEGFRIPEEEFEEAEPAPPFRFPWWPA